MDSKAIAANAQRAVLDSIPAKWRLSEAFAKDHSKSAIEKLKDCSILTARQIDLTEKTATELVADLATGQVTSVEVTEAFCTRAAIAHQLTNCLIEFFPDEALETAQMLDDYFKKHKRPIGPLHGLPVSIKDLYDLKGHLVTLGWITWNGTRSGSDAAVVQLLRDAGAVFFVKTTMPQAGMALETVSSLYGRTLNPFNPELTCGGSSGGEGALIALKGSPIGPATDIGGSIRAPAAFNGLYGIRPSSSRISRRGARTTVPGQISIRTSAGPLCHSMEDLKMFTKVMFEDTKSHIDGTSVPLPWKHIEAPVQRLRLGYFEFDGVCMPHPPILRGLRETAAKLKEAGHEVVEMKLPFDCWEAALVTWSLFFPTGAIEAKETAAAGNEELIPALKYHLEAFNVKALSAKDLLQFNAQQIEYQSQMARAIANTSTLTVNGSPIDCIICPVHASASYPHDFPAWWGYTSLFNLLDYPSTVLPIKKLRISRTRDAIDTAYQPESNPFDKITHELYDPELFSAQPVCIQVVGLPHQDESLIAASETIDQIINQ